ncbi:MBL fold metallo-hydrolase [Desulfovibrio sp. OttesenSCG-928-C14]|nr:MBL fold metallo-hydrolase [Desulfovibrio sp. OttesenSCG-928-C14]
MIEKLWDQPDIYLIPVPLPENPLKNLNCYVIRAGRESLVIDTGFNRPECAQALEAGLAELGIEPEHTKLYLTHLHSDHCGLAMGFAAKGIPIYMSAIDHECLRLNLDGTHWRTLGGRFLREGFPESEMALQIEGNQAKVYAPKGLFPATGLSGGDSLAVGPWEFSCIHTPGHTPGHTCLYHQEQQLLFSGDHILFDITPNIAVWNNVPRSLADYLDSLQKIKALPVAQTFPGHRKRLGDAHARVDAITEHHRQRLQEILDTLRAQPGLQAYEVAGRISWSAKGKPWSEFPPNQRWFAMGETLSHLDWLVDAGQVSRSEDVTYSPTGQELAWPEL